MQIVLALGAGTQGVCVQFLALPLTSCVTLPVRSSPGPQNPLLPNGLGAPLCGNMLKPLEGAGRGGPQKCRAPAGSGNVAPKPLLCLSCVAGPRGRAWAAWVSSKYHCSHLLSVPMAVFILFLPTGMPFSICMTKLWLHLVRVAFPHCPHLEGSFPPFSPTGLYLCCDPVLP